MTATSIAMMRLPATEPAPPACGFAPEHCKFRRLLVKAYLIAYREAAKCGDDPAEYIRDCIRGSRDNTIDPMVRGPRRDPFDANDIKLALERARDVHGIELNAWNADRIARACCAEHWDVEASR